MRERAAGSLPHAEGPDIFGRPIHVPSPQVPMPALSERRRSVAFLESEGETWACFLVTSPSPDGQWHGFFSFRPGSGEAEEDEVRTADIFIEPSEAEIHEKARGLGRPLLTGLLESALHTSARTRGNTVRLRSEFRNLLAENAQELAGDWAADTAHAEAPPADESHQHLRSLYESYRLDQVAHFICLVEPPAFEAAVDRILEGEQVDFLSTDRIQYAMMVVEYVEKRLPLPPFEVWAEDFTANPEAYRIYSHTLHREGRLP